MKKIMKCLTGILLSKVINWFNFGYLQLIIYRHQFRNMTLHMTFWNVRKENMKHVFIISVKEFVLQLPTILKWVPFQFFVYSTIEWPKKYNKIIQNVISYFCRKHHESALNSELFRYKSVKKMDNQWTAHNIDGTNFYHIRMRNRPRPTAVKETMVPTCIPTRETWVEPNIPDT